MQLVPPFPHPAFASKEERIVGIRRAPTDPAFKVMYNIVEKSTRAARAAWAALLKWERPISRVLNVVVPATLLVLLGYDLLHIGLAQVWSARPNALLFYVFGTVPFFIPPLTDLIIYRHLWKVGAELRYSVMLRKQCLNNVIDYSGETYFLISCQRTIGVPTNVKLHAIKDSNVLSAGAGFVTLCLGLILLLALDGKALSGFSLAGSWTIFAFSFVPLALCIALVIGGGRLTTLTRGEMASTFALHLLRSGTVLFFTYLCWFFSGALPTAALCLDFVVLRQLITRLPIVPSKPLLYAEVALVAAGSMNVSQPRVAAVIIITTIISQVLGIIGVAAPWLIEKFLAGVGDVEATT
jgi:hypothetical protein